MHADFQITGTHAMAFPSNVLAQKAGEHIYHVKLASNTDNGNLIAVGDYVDLDYFDEAAVTSFAGEIVKQMTNGNWLVLVKNPGDACLVYQKPLTPYESPTALKSEKVMYNKKDDIVRAYGLHKHDRFEVSEEAFSGDDPEVGATISSVVSKKMVVTGAGGATGETN